jgi:hypothetical protein
MPVIRGEPTTTALSEDRRTVLLQQLTDERSGKSIENGPVIFEIPLEGSSKMDVMVVWEVFKDLHAEDRTALILEAYQEQKNVISQALGVTYAEALDQQLLPYAVLPMSRPGEADAAELRKRMLEQGGICIAGEKVDLRFPTMAMAEAAHRKLSKQLPNGYWSIVQTVAPIS